MQLYQLPIVIHLKTWRNHQTKIELSDGTITKAADQPFDGLFNFWFNVFFNIDNIG